MPVSAAFAQKAISNINLCANILKSCTQPSNFCRFGTPQQRGTQILPFPSSQMIVNNYKYINVNTATSHFSLLSSHFIDLCAKRIPQFLISNFSFLIFINSSLLTPIFSLEIQRVLRTGQQDRRPVWQRCSSVRESNLVQAMGFMPAVQDCRHALRTLTSSQQCHLHGKARDAALFLFVFLLKLT